MKTTSLSFTVFLLVCTFSASAQETGVYLTEKAFKNNEVHHLAANSKSNSLLISPRQGVILKRGSEREKFRFNQVYGYYKNGERYRKFGEVKAFSKYGYARLLDSDGLFLYSAYYNVHKVARTHYFYSLSQDSPLTALTRKNLKRDFSNNPKFLEAVTSRRMKDLMIKNNDGYLINEIYQKYGNGAK